MSPNSPVLADMLLLLGRMYLETDDASGGRLLLERALAIRLRASGDGHQSVTMARTSLGRALGLLGEWELALEQLAQSTSAAGDDMALRVEADFRMAQVLWLAPATAGGDRRRAYALAVAARDAAAARSEPLVEAAEIDRWLQQHLPPD